MEAEVGGADGAAVSSVEAMLTEWNDVSCTRWASTGIPSTWVHAYGGWAQTYRCVSMAVFGSAAHWVCASFASAEDA